MTTTIDTISLEKITIAQRLNHVKEYYFAAKMRQIADMQQSGIDVINLGIGSPDLPPAPSVIQALQQHSANIANHSYQPYAGLPQLREAFANWYDNSFAVSLNLSTEILPLIGSKEGIMHIAMTFLQPGDEVLIPNPGYPSYKAASQLAGATTREYLLSEKNNWLPDIDVLEQMDLSAVKIMWMNYPNMPTGSQASMQFFERIIALAQKHQFLVVNDNPYNFILNDSPISILSIPGAKSVALELNSLSKSHNMAGWRIGMVAGHADYIKSILRFKSNMDSGMFKPTQMAAIEALKLGPEWYDNLNQIYAKRRAVAYQILTALGCTYTLHQTGLFVWAKIPASAKSGFELSDMILQKHHVFLTPGGIFGSQGERYIRLSLCNSIKVFTQVLNKIKTL